MSKPTLQDVAIDLGDTLAVRQKLAEMGIRPALLMKSLNTKIKWQCLHGGRGISCTHEFEATPLEALENGCEHCELERHIKEDEPEVVPEAVLLAAVKKQHAAMTKSNKLALKRSRRRGATVGKYAV